MANKEKILIENEKQANYVVAKVMRITFIFFTVIFLLNVIGVFVVNKTVMTIAYIFGSLLLFLPTILLKICKEKYVFIKIVNICVAVILAISFAYKKVNNKEKVRKIIIITLASVLLHSACRRAIAHTKVRS